MMHSLCGSIFTKHRCTVIHLHVYITRNTPVTSLSVHMILGKVPTYVLYKHSTEDYNIILCNNEYQFKKKKWKWILKNTNYSTILSKPIGTYFYDMNSVGVVFFPSIPSLIIIYVDWFNTSTYTSWTHYLYKILIILYNFKQTALVTPNSCLLSTSSINGTSLFYGVALLTF